MSLYKKFSFFKRPTPTIRYSFSWLLLLISGASVAVALNSTSENRVIISVPSNVQAVGKSYPVDIFVSAKDPINAVTLAIDVPKELEVQSINKGDSVITLWTKDPAVIDNVVYLEGGTYRRGFVGKHKIATLQVKAKTETEATFSLKTVGLYAGDGKGTQLMAEDIGLVTALVRHSNHDSEQDEKKLTQDLTNDGKVSLADMSVFLVAWTTKNQLFDFNNDGKMTFGDFSILLTTLSRS